MSKRLCDKSFKLLGQFPYNEEFDFIFQKQTSPFSGIDDFQIHPEQLRESPDGKMLLVTWLGDVITSLKSPIRHF